MSTHLILLAAGEGSRMQSDLPKVLHEVAGAPLFAHALASASELDAGKRIMVVGYEAEAVMAAAKNYDEDIEFAHQTEQLGTGHAALQAAPFLAEAGGHVVVVFGDTPFIRPATLNAMSDARASGADVVVLGFDAKVPGRYGRLVCDGDRLLKIVEWNDATEAEKAITLCNSGVMLTETETLLRLLKSVQPDNAAGEYYLTDVVGLAASEGLSTKVVKCDEAETLGINTREDLALAESVFQTRARADAIANGVTLQAPDTVIFSQDTTIGRDAIVEAYVVFGTGVTVETGAKVRAFSHLEGAHVGAGAIVGPYARLRPGTELSNDARIGNFVETKNVLIGEGTKINHLSYVGDAEIGAGTNVGAGTITCNYDGVFKHRTEIGNRVFIGSNTLLVAPISVGDEAMTATGSVITKDVPAGDLAVARARQENKAGFARRFFKKLRAAKAKAKG